MTIKEMKNGMENYPFQAIISQVSVGKTNGNNKTFYLNLILQDRTASIEAKLWNAKETDIDTFTRGTVVEGKGDIILYKGAIQMKVVDIHKKDVTEKESLEYLPVAPIEKEDMMSEITSTINQMKDKDLKLLTESIVNDYYEDFVSFPAATRNHHDVISGLLYHTYTMLKIGKLLSAIYEVDNDLLFSGIILHDIGKVKEFTGAITPNYSVEGNLLGHVSMGETIVSNKAIELGINNEKIILLRHMILSHHGKKEFGSPVLPMTKEALLLSSIDDLDAKMNMFDKELEKVVKGEFTRRIFPMDNRILYKPKD